MVVVGLLHYGRCMPVWVQYTPFRRFTVGHGARAARLSPHCGLLPEPTAKPTTKITMESKFGPLTEPTARP